MLVCAAACGADGKLDRATLKDLKAVSIVIDPIDPELQSEGVDPDFLRATIQAKLEKAGITVDKSANEFLGLRVTAAQGKRMPVALCLSLGLYQAVVLARNRDIHTATETWSVDSVASAQPQGGERRRGGSDLRSRRQLRDRLPLRECALTGRFGAQYLAQNLQGFGRPERLVQKPAPRKRKRT